VVSVETAVGGGFGLLKIQIIGIVCVCAWTAVTISLTFTIIKATIGLRVTEEEEIIGLDGPEHGLTSAYAGFSMMDISTTDTFDRLPICILIFL
jgi:Amt family ammonium transporter